MNTAYSPATLNCFSSLPLSTKLKGIGIGHKYQVEDKKDINKYNILS